VGCAWDIGSLMRVLRTCASPTY